MSQVRSRDSSQPPRPVVKRWRVALAIAVTIALLGFLIIEIAHAEPLLNATRNADPVWILAACAYAALAVALAVVRWRQVLTAMGHDVSFARGAYAVLAGCSIAAVTPSRLGEFVRAWLIRDRAPLAEGASSMLVERAIDLHTLLLLGVAFAVGAQQSFEAAVMGALMIAEWAVVYLIVKKRYLVQNLRILVRFRATIDGLARGFEAVLTKPRTILSVTLSSVVIRIITVAVLHSLLVAVGERSSFIALIAPWMLATLAGMIPITMAGMGTRDAVFVVLMGTGADSEPKLVFATLGYALITVWGFALLGLPLLLRAGLSDATEQESP